MQNLGSGVYICGLKYGWKYTYINISNNFETFFHIVVVKHFAIVVQAADAYPIHIVTLDIYVDFFHFR